MHACSVFVDYRLFCPITVVLCNEIKGSISLRMQLISNICILTRHMCSLYASSSSSTVLVMTMVMQVGLHMIIHHSRRCLVLPGVYLQYCIRRSAQPLATVRRSLLERFKR